MIKRVGRPRVWIYGTLLLLLSSVFVVSLSNRKGFIVDVMKDRGSPAREVDRGDIENVYRIQIMNGLEQRQSYRISVGGLPALALSVTSVEVQGRTPP
jgi:polyferredoxin